MRHKREMKMCLDLLKYNIEIIQDVWRKEIEENGGKLSDKISILLSDSHNMLCTLETKTQDIVYKYNQAQTFPKVIFDYNQFWNYKQKLEGEVKAYNFTEMRDIFPPRLLDSTVTLSYVMNYVSKQLMITVEKLGLQDEIDKLFNTINQYISYTEHSLICDYYIVDKIKEEEKEYE